MSQDEALPSDIQACHALIETQDELLKRFARELEQARFWLARGSEHAPYNVFFFHESRHHDGPSKFLGDYQGDVTVDAYGVNDGVYLPKKNAVAEACILAVEGIETRIILWIF